MCPDRFSEKTPLWFDSHMRPPPVSDPPKNRILNGSRLYREFAHFQTLSPVINPVRVIISEFARIRIFRAASTFRKNKKTSMKQFRCVLSWLYTGRQMKKKSVMHERRCCLLLIIFFPDVLATVAVIYVRS